MIINPFRMILAATVLITLGSAQLNTSGLDDSLINFSINHGSSDIMNKTTKIIENVSLDISKINSSNIIILKNLSDDLLSNPYQSKPNIKMEDAHTATGYDLSGYYSDCTFTLNNTGDADGVAIINFELDNTLKEKTSFLVPAKRALKFNEKISLPLSSALSFDSVEILCYVESQRKATIMDFIDPNIRKK
jgi:hypothetical protein